MSKCRLAIAMAAVVLLLVSAPVIRSLDFDDRSATATVVTALTVTATQDLDFGNVFAGVPKTMGWDVNDSSGIFTITGEASTGINLQMSLPSYLSLSNGSDRIPITFSSTDAAVDTTTVTPATMTGTNGWTNQNPYSLPSAAVIGAAGTTKIYLGGKVAPSVNQKSGAYSGDIVLSVTYNGT